MERTCGCETDRVDFSPGYREWAPPAALAHSVTCLWSRVAAPQAAAAGPTTSVLPDACADLIWQRGRGVFFAGPDTGPVPSALPAGTVLVGVRFAPGAGGPALGLPLSAVLNQRVDAADLSVAAGHTLARRVPGWLDPPAALSALTAVACELAAAGPADMLATGVVSLLAQPTAAARDIAAALGVSDRQLRRRCHAAVGYGPATLRQVLRFRRFVDWADTGRVPGWADGGGAVGADGGGAGAGEGGWALARVAAQAGYADQAHLTRDCARFAGLTPAALVRVRRG
jgi:AraC-like DNA-binding protein